MTLTEKIAKEIASYEKEFAECETTIKIAAARKDCLKDTIEMLRELLDKAQNEPSQPAVEENKLAKTVRKKKTQTENAEATTENESPESGVSMKSLAEKLNTPLPNIANICNSLGFNDKMARNNYLLTEEQAAAVESKFAESNNG